MSGTGTWLDGCDAPPRIEGRRMALRAPQADDAAGAFAFLGDARAMRYWSAAPLSGEVQDSAIYGLLAREFRAPAASGPEPPASGPAPA